MRTAYLKSPLLTPSSHAVSLYDGIIKDIESRLLRPEISDNPAGKARHK